MTTAEALQASVKHWQRLAAGKAGPKETVFSKDCPLCEKFLMRRRVEKQCVGCPIFERTGAKYCNLSPWVEASEATYAGYNTKVFKAAAGKMVLFLKSLKVKPE